MAPKRASAHLMLTAMYDKTRGPMAWVAQYEGVQAANG